MKKKRERVRAMQRANQERQRKCSEYERYLGFSESCTVHKTGDQRSNARLVWKNAQVENAQKQRQHT